MINSLTIINHTLTITDHMLVIYFVPPAQGPTEPALGILTALCRNCAERQDGGRWALGSPKVPTMGQKWVEHGITLWGI